ncbi:MAG TPA: hypothetical protein VL625_04545 [Patescibacteria group bacterium]|nr:hypothetical protein [Patescibacteria group bacterium]
MDRGAEETPVGSHPALEAMDQFHRPEDEARKEPLQDERDPARLPLPRLSRAVRGTTGTGAVRKGDAGGAH